MGSVADPFVISYTRTASDENTRRPDLLHFGMVQQDLLSVCG